MPELPEVQTTVSGLQKVLPKLSIKDVWTDFEKMFHSIAFSKFKKEILNKKVISIKRRAKNILINLSGNKTVLIHMKMTGHLMVGYYKKTYDLQPTTNKKKKEVWIPHEKEKNEALRNPFNRFIHAVFTLSNGKHLVFCDTRKFGKIALIETDKLLHSPHLAHLGPEPLPKNFTYKIFRERIFKRQNTKIKTALMDQTVISGIGNIYSDEILFHSGVNPEERVRNLPEKLLQKVFRAIKPALKGGIHFGGDSTSDYRNVDGKKGKFQNKHMAYRKTGKPCQKHQCKGVILRKIVNGRSAHFCSKHQKLLCS
ncbi:MAG: bifunctional DNA-formamidopyrimidine glycosylase/DNA-(apurinic or apyrimidinic site) lyase [Patescibacteria group bacterium]